jgi:dimethylsulfoniopropionate demethylase
MSTRRAKAACEEHHWVEAKRMGQPSYHLDRRRRSGFINCASLALKGHDISLRDSSATSDLTRRQLKSMTRINNAPGERGSMKLASGVRKSEWILGSDTISIVITMPSVPTLAISHRTRSTPFSTRVEAAGLQSYTVYNHMLLPTSFRGVEDDYFHLRRAVQVWDVACERQVEIAGPDAARLAQMLTVRDLRSLSVGRCGYAPIVDDDGLLINDPVVLRVADDRFWFSVADSDVVLWAGGIARSLGLDVSVGEPDIWPLAIQGPLAEDVAAAVFGDAVRAIKFFRFAELEFQGHPLVVARTGWSAQGGFEIYVDDTDIGGALYDAVMTAGEPHDIGPGCPNHIERIEAGLLSYGNDVTRADTALEAGLGKYCALDAPIEAIGLDALRRQRDSGLPRRVCGLVIDGDAVPALRNPWPTAIGSGSNGFVTSAVWSPRLMSNVALAMVDSPYHAIGTCLVVATPNGERTATVVDVPFPGAIQR